MATSRSADAATRGSRSTPVFWIAVFAGLAAAWGWIPVAQYLGDTIMIASPALAATLFYAILFGPLIVIAAAAGRATGTRVFAPGDAPGRWLGAGLAIGALGLCVAVFYSWLNGGLVRGVEPTGAWLAILLGLALTLLQTGSEEVLFRGWLQPALASRLGAVAAVVLSALLFSAFHIAGGARAPVALVNLMLGGVLFGLLALRSGGLAAPVAAHFAWNATEDLGFGLVPNPGIGPLGALVDLDLAGPAHWGGSEEGLNTSVGMTVVLAALVVLLLARSVRSKPAAAAAA